jgi:hypothetical protein
VEAGGAVTRFAAAVLGAVRPGAQVASVGSCGGAGVQKQASSQEGHDDESLGTGAFGSAAHF